MQKFGLIGFPVKHSYSAAMHNAAFSALGIDASYELWEIEPQKLASEFARLVKEGVCGLNVTVPHKEAVIKLVDNLDQQAELIGAANTVKVLGNKSTKGFNTDGLGFISHLKDVIGFQPKDKCVSVLGAGGAAKAVTLQLAKSGARCVSLFDLDKVKTENLAAKLTSHFPDCKIQITTDADGLLKEKPDLLINATPLGMHQNDPLVFDASYFHRRLVIYDLVYNPAQTRLLREAKAKGCLGVFNGLGMLLHQGVLAFKIWMGVEPPIEVMERALAEALNKGQ